MNSAVGARVERTWPLLPEPFDDLRSAGTLRIASADGSGGVRIQPFISTGGRQRSQGLAVQSWNRSGSQIFERMLANLERFRRAPSDLDMAKLVSGATGGRCPWTSCDWCNSRHAGHMLARWSCAPLSFYTHNNNGPCWKLFSEHPKGPRSGPPSRTLNLHVAGRPVDPQGVPENQYPTPWGPRTSQMKKSGIRLSLWP